MQSSHGRVVKACDSNVDVIFTRRFEASWLQFVLANEQIFKWVKKEFFFSDFFRIMSYCGFWSAF